LNEKKSSKSLVAVIAIIAIILGNANRIAAIAQKKVLEKKYIEAVHEKLPNSFFSSTYKIFDN
jgi:hypothetical protein